MTGSYKDSGVDIEAGNRAVELIKDAAASTFSPAVLTGLGSFGAFFDLSGLIGGYREPVLVQSVDGVGTKMIVAGMAGDFSRIGADLLAACCNDIAVHGARPLTFLDYIAVDRLVPEVVAEIVTGMAAACRETGVSLIGGETAEMPGTYAPGEHDLAGMVTGIVERSRIINGSGIKPGDAVLGAASRGLHTNGYSLARRILFQEAELTVNSPLPESSRGRAGNREKPVTLGDALLEPHINYTRAILKLLDSGAPVRGMAHITGGGLVENVPRVLPGSCRAVIDPSAWELPPIFTFLQTLSDLPEEEWYRTFNMGIGLVLIVPKEHKGDVLSAAAQLFSVPVKEIGEITERGSDPSTCSTLAPPGGGQTPVHILPLTGSSR